MHPLNSFDTRLFAALYGGPDGAWRCAMTALTVIGGGWATVLLVPMACWRSTRRHAWALAMAIAIQASLVWLLKLAVGRVRPWVAMALPPPFGAPSDGSFPSGHAAGSFCVAAFLLAWLSGSPRLGRRCKVLLGVTVIALAVLVSISRVYLGAHYPGDVLGGAGLGALVGACAARPWGCNRTTKRVPPDA